MIGAATIAKKSAPDLAQVEEEFVFGSHEGWATEGVLTISDPSTSFGLFSVDDSVAPAEAKTFFGSVFQKYANPATDKQTKIINTDVASYIEFLNRQYSNWPVQARMKTRNGIPLGTWEALVNMFDISNNPEMKVKARVFTWQNVGYIIVDLDDADSGTDGVRVGGELQDFSNVNSCDAEVVAHDAYNVVHITGRTTGEHFAITSLHPTTYKVDDEWVDTRYGLGTVGGPLSNTTVFWGIGDTGGGHATCVFAFTIDPVAATAIARVADNIADWRTHLKEAEDWWYATLLPVSKGWQQLPATLRYRGLIGVHEVLASSYGGYFCPGIGLGDCCFLRDSSYAALGLIDTLPDKAEEILAWFADAADLSNRNQFRYDKTDVALAYWNTDNGAIFLKAIGDLYAKTGDTAFITSMKTQADRALAYAQNQYVSAAKHITAKHAHDYWDDYVPAQIDTAVVKYESLVDVMWISGLEAMEKVYHDLADATRESFCHDTAAGLRTGLEDYRQTDGSLAYAIKTDDTLYSTVKALPGTLYAAWLLRDAECAEYLCYGSNDMSGRGVNFPYGTTFSRLLTESTSLASWSPHFPQVALVLARDYSMTEPAFWLAEQFPAGALPEYSKADLTTGKLMYNSSVRSHPWAEAMMILLMNEVQKIK